MTPHQMLQWGQRLSALDTAKSWSKPRATAVASMGPTPFSVGYKHWEAQFPPPHSSFNGANAFQRWIRFRRNSSSSRASGFNGANAFQRWILAEITLLRDFWREASMGPTPFSVGYACPAAAADAALGASMGPTPFSVGYSLFAALFAYYTAFRRRMSSFCARVFLLDAESRRFSPVRADFCPLFCERPFLGGSPPERSQPRLGDVVDFTRAGGGAYSAVKERRAPRYAERICGSASFSSGQRGISDSWTPRTSSASRQKLLKASSLTG